MPGKKIIQKEKLEALLTERPKFHGREDAGTVNYAISDDVIRWMTENLPNNAATLETGCGYSTVGFALFSSRHTVISPFPQEFELLQKWCLENQVDVEHVEFIASISQIVIHSLENQHPLDMVLIDGDHAFPGPFIDWYFTADRIKKGGFVVVDDTQLITGQILKEFLQAEAQRWSLECELGKTSIFKKSVSTPVAEGIPWIHQPYVNRGLFPLK